MIRCGRLVLLVCFALPLLACAPAVHKGGMAPDFALQSLRGEQVRLSDFRGRPVLVNFWASWCLPCRGEMADLQRTREALGEDQLVILAVNVLDRDDLQDVREFVRDLGLSFPILLDRDGAVAEAYLVQTLPTSFFIDPGGRIHLIQLGPMSQAFVESVLREMR